LSSTLPAPLPQTLALEAAPPLALEDQHGGTVRLSDYRGRRVVLVFFRGHW
jgi:peroxiredoxin